MVKNIIILHGWQSKLSRWSGLQKELASNFNVYLPQIPGFGEKKLEKPFSLKDYINWLSWFLKQEKINKKDLCLIGHSHGGRIAAAWAGSKKGRKLEKLVLIASAGIKSGLSFKKLAGFIVAKTGRLLFLISPLSFLKKGARFFLYKLLREKDYYESDKVMQKTMKNMLKTDLTKKLKNIKADTLLLWGDNDKSTPLKHGFVMENRIPKARLVVFKKEDHSLPFTRTDDVLKLITDFCKKKK